MKPPCIALIDDEREYHELVRTTLRHHPLRPNIETFASPKEFFSFVGRGGSPTAILCDYKLPGTNGVEFAQQFYERGYRAPVFLITGLDNIRDYAFNAMREGYVNERLILKNEVNSREKFAKTLDEIAAADLLVQPRTEARDQTPRAHKVSSL